MNTHILSLVSLDPLVLWHGNNSIGWPKFPFMLFFEPWSMCQGCKEAKQESKVNRSFFRKRMYKLEIIEWIQEQHQEMYCQDWKTLQSRFLYILLTRKFLEQLLSTRKLLNQLLGSFLTNFHRLESFLTNFHQLGSFLSNL